MQSNIVESRSRGLACLVLLLVVGCSAHGEQTPGAPVPSSQAGSSSAGAATLPTGGAGGFGVGAGVGGAALGGAPMQPVSGVYPASVLCPAPMALPKGELSQGFASTCAGCHGPSGDGQGPFPSLKNVADLVTFARVVRGGRELMPAFDAQLVSDAQLAADFEALRASAKLVTADPDCGPGAAELVPLSSEELELRIARGMEVYRRPGPKGACAGCHSAAAIDMAFIGFSDANILRRAIPNIGAADAPRIVDMVHALRQLYAVDRPLHPLKFRFLQPGHEVLPELQQSNIQLGDAPGAHDAARDRAFAKYLTDDVKLLLAGETISSLEQAVAAQKQLLELDLTQLKVGVPVELWTEDGFRGSEHNVPTEWIPMLARTPAAGHETEWYQLVDAYRADASDEKLWRLYDAIPMLTSDDSAYPLAARWSRHKYESVQVASHMLLARSLRTPNTLAGVSETDVVKRRDIAIARNPFWRVGDSIRVNPFNCNTTDPCTTVSSALELTINAGDAARERMTLEEKLSWFWLGYSLDPALLVTEAAVPTIDGDYFLAATQQYYNVHNAFLVASIMTHKANAPAEYLDMKGVATAGHGLWASPRPFLAFKHSERELHTPPPLDQRTLVHARLWANALRMALYLMNDELGRTHQVFDRARTLQNVKFMRHWFGTSLELGADLTALDALVTQLTSRLAEATEIAQVDASAYGDTPDPVVLPEQP